MNLDLFGGETEVVLHPTMKQRAQYRKATELHFQYICGFFGQFFLQKIFPQEQPISQTPSFLKSGVVPIRTYIWAVSIWCPENIPKRQ